METPIFNTVYYLYTDDAITFLYNGDEMERNFKNTENL